MMNFFKKKKMAVLLFAFTFLFTNSVTAYANYYGIGRNFTTNHGVISILQFKHWIQNGQVQIILDLFYILFGLGMVVTGLKSVLWMVL